MYLKAVEIMKLEVFSLSIPETARGREIESKSE
jgi:hypothetical protein